MVSVELSIHEQDRDGKATQRGLRPGIIAVTAALVDDVLPELEEIIDQLRPQFAALVAPLELAAQEFGFT